MQKPRTDRSGRNEAGSSEFLDWVKKGALIGALVLFVLVPGLQVLKAPKSPPQAQPPVASAPTQPLPHAPRAAPTAPGTQLADFRGEDPSPDARLVANWVAHTRNNKNHGFVIVDKKDARVYVFAPDGKLRDSAPALLGSAQGDDSYPGIGDKPLSEIKPYEKTTPAGRFVAEMGLNAGNEDVVWVDYDAAVSMHRIRPLHASEHRLERLASLTTDDNRISFGCINLPVSFYENVLSPTVKSTGAVVYVLPEKKSPQEVFGAYDVTDPIQWAAAQAEERAKPQRVALQAGATRPVATR